LEASGLGLKIGNISVSNTACADDIALISKIPDEAQTLVNMITDFAFMEGYQLQPTKSVVRNVSSKKNQTYNRKSIVYKRFSVSICEGAMRSYRK
jgi:hypothetical protein